ncbi:MAG: DNA polymerase I, partial [Spirochaetaceae bacterium]
MNKTLYVIDGYGIIYQSYFAFINRPLLNPMGQNSQAVFGFFRTLFEFVRTKKPEHCIVVLDSKTPTFRHLEYPEYKAHREETPQDLYDQIDVIESILEKLGVAMLRVNGFEADDLAATLAVACPKAGFRCTILSRDKDILQLVNENVSVLRGKNQELSGEEWSRENVHESIGIWPEQMVDYLALTGDQSDNIPGVMGVGPKTAVKLLSEYKTLEGIYEKIESVKGAVHDKLLAGKENAFLSRRLATLDNAVPCSCEPSSFQLKLDTKSALPMFVQQGMKSIVQSLGGYTPASGTQATKEKDSKGKADTDDATVETVSSGGTVSTPGGSALTSTRPGTFESILSEEKLHKIIKEATAAGIFAFDTETDSLDSMQAELVGMSIALEPGKAWYIPIQSSGTNCLPLDVILAGIRPLLENPKLLLVGQNIKYDYKVLHHAGLTIKTRLFDTMVAAWLLDTDAQSTFNLDDLAEKYLSHKTIHYEDVVEKGSLWNLSHVDLQQAADYAAEDAD